MVKVKNKKRRNTRRVRKAPFRTYIQRLAHDEGCHINTDSVAIVNHDIEYLVNEIMKRANNMHQHCGYKTFTRDSFRMCIAGLYHHNPTLVKSVLDTEQQVYNRFVNNDYASLSDDDELEPSE